METLTSCNVASITPFIPTGNNPWDVKKARHLYRRLGFGATDAIINIALNTSPQAAVDSIINKAQAAPNTATPPWGFWGISNYTDYQAESNVQADELYRTVAREIGSQGLKNRLSFFWSNHFVTQREVYLHPPYTYQYWDLLQTHAMGNFRDFVRAIGLDPAMLLFLNGFQNTNVSPNENYARELYELFTLGQDNGYTQTDIEETARALTGYNHWTEPGGTMFFDNSTFDNSVKVIFDQEGSWGYDDVIDILFEQRAPEIAHFICTKLYTFFVSRSINESIVEALASTFLANDFDLVPVYDQLFKSEHFFDLEAVGHVIKSPFDVAYTYLNETNFQFDDSTNEVTNLVLLGTNLLGQTLFDPIDVAGWQRDRDWINSSTITGRWLFLDIISNHVWNYDSEQFRNLAIQLTNNSNDPDFITEQIVNFFVSRPLFTAMDYEIASGIFRWEIPPNYYDDGLWNLSWDSVPLQVLLLLNHIFRMPEFQLK